MASLGHLSLLFVLVLCCYAMVAGFLGGKLVRPRLVRSAERALVAAWVLTMVAMGSVITLLVTSDFRYAYVWGHSNRDLPTFYKVTSLWAGQQGSLLLWGFVILTYGAAAVFLNRRKNRTLMPYVVAVVASSAAFFALVNVFVANPFEEIALVSPSGAIRSIPDSNLPADGNGLNPILQHPAMVIHPPVLYTGYVGFIIPFAFCIAALIARELGDGWIRTTRRWTLFPWMFLGTGVLMGGRWAYVELGWGGYWGWDPVENASLLPWLVGTAFLHSVIIQEKRGMLKVWNVVLVLLAYTLSIFGTFTTRSGLMSSVHAFAQSDIGKWFVGYIALLVIGTTYLLVTRLPALKTENHFESMKSREGSFLFNNLLFLAMCFSVLFGTLWPVLSEAIKGEKEGVGPAYFNAIERPLGLAILFLTGVGPLLAWRKNSTTALWRNFSLPIGLGLATGGVLYASGMRHVWALASLSIAAFVTATIVAELYRGGRARAHSIGSGFFTGLADLVQRNKRRYGGYLVHFAMVVLFIGFTGKAFETETKVPVAIGDKVNIRGYTLTVENLIENDTSNPNYERSAMRLALTRGDEKLATLEPESRMYHASEQLTTEVARFSGLTEDVYTVFVRTGPDAPPEVQVFVNPLVRLVWTGGFLMFFSTLFTMLPDRRGPRTEPAGLGAGAGRVAEPTHA